jgi:hypothetical protein
MATIVPISHSAATLCSLTKEFNMNYLKNLFSPSNADNFSSMSDKGRKGIVHWIRRLGSVIYEEVYPLVDLLLKSYFPKMTPEEVDWALEYSSPETLIFLLKSPSSQLMSLLENHHSQWGFWLRDDSSQLSFLAKNPFLLKFPSPQLSPEQRMKAVNRLIEICKFSILIDWWDTGKIYTLDWVQLTLPNEQCTAALKSKVTEHAIGVLSHYNSICYGQLSEEQLKQIHASVETAVLKNCVGQLLLKQWEQLTRIRIEQCLELESTQLPDWLKIAVKKF